MCGCESAMEEVGAQVAAPIYLRQSLSSRFCDAPAAAAMGKKKRDLPYQTPNYQHPNSQPRFANPGTNSWNPSVWGWDSMRFVAKPLDTEMMGTSNSEPKRKEEAAGVVKSTAVVVEDDDERLQLNLGGGLASVEDPAASRPNKRVRSGSPGNNGGSYPMCQVDDCKEDLSSAKDYHRRHKVCESHSKSTKALVAKQMQRFCQQCSRLLFIQASAAISFICLQLAITQNFYLLSRDCFSYL